MLHQRLPDTIYILCDDGVLDQLGLLLDLLGELATKGLFLLDRIEVQLLADTAITDPREIVASFFLGVLLCRNRDFARLLSRYAFRRVNVWRHGAKSWSGIIGWRALLQC